MPKNEPERMIAQEKDGFYKFPNMLSEALTIAKLPPSQKDICYHLLRRTLGWNQKEAAISLRDFAYICDSDRSWVSKQIKELQKNNIIHITGIQNQKHVYTMNFDISSWDKSCIDIDRLINIPRGSPHIDNKSSSTSKVFSSDSNQGSNTTDQVLYSATTPAIFETEPLYPTTTPVLYPAATPVLYPATTLEPPPALEGPKEEAALNTLLNTYKNNIIKGIYFKDSIYYQLAKLMADLLQSKDDKENPDVGELSKVVDIMIRYENRHPEEIKKLMIFSQEHEFWRKMIINIEKFHFFYDSIKTKRAMVLSSSPRKIEEEEYPEFEVYYIS